MTCFRGRSENSLKARLEDGEKPGGRGEAWRMGRSFPLLLGFLFPFYLPSFLSFFSYLPFPFSLLLWPIVSILFVSPYGWL
jgi:hypothetical protein